MSSVVVEDHPWWAPCESSIVEHTGQLSRALEELERDTARHDRRALDAALLAAGTLTLMGTPPAPASPTTREAIRRYVLRLSVEALAARARALGDSIGPLTGPARRRALALLDARDALERRLIGARSLHSIASTVPDPAGLTRVDAILRASLFRLVELNDARERRLVSVAPHQRARLWWWSEGLDLSEHAPAALAEVAALVARFPEARRRFEHLLRSSRELASLRAHGD
jgi:hypothetical protein